MGKEYKPYGPEWEKEMMRLSKKFLVAELRRIYKENKRLMEGGE